MNNYKRLTERSGKSGIGIKETSTNTNLSIWNAIERLADLEDKIEDGTLIELPCKVGSTIYRIDFMPVHCSHRNSYYHEYWCGGCPHLKLGDCDYKEKPYIFVIKNAKAQEILGNEHLIGSRAFLTEAEAKQSRYYVEKGVGI